MEPKSLLSPFGRVGVMRSCLQQGDLMKKILLSLTLSAGLLLSACGSQTSQGTFQSLTIVDNGTVVPEPLRTTLTISADGSIDFLSETVHIDNTVTTVDHWTGDLSQTDLAALTTLITTNSLNTQSDVDLPSGEEACAGASSLDVSLETSTTTNDFSISGTVRCNDTLIPAGVQALLDKTDEFETTYNPVF